MRTWLASAAVLSLAVSCSAAQQAQPAAVPATRASEPPAPNTLLDGTPVKLRLAENLSSANAKAGQQVAFEVVEEVDVEGVPVIPKFAKAIATVTDASPKKMMGRGGKLDVNVDSVRLIDGEKAQLRAVQGGKGGGHVGAMTGAMVATAIVFFPAAPLFLFIKGKDIVIPEGTIVTAFVEGDMKLDMKKMVPPDTARLMADQKAAAANHASLAVTSNIAGADIEVDGTFMGNTPSSVSVTPGTHLITIKKKGYADWSRTMTVSGDGAQLSADLESGTTAPPPAAALPPAAAPQP